MLLPVVAAYCDDKFTSDARCLQTLWLSNFTIPRCLLFTILYFPYISSGKTTSRLLRPNRRTKIVGITCIWKRTRSRRCNEIKASWFEIISSTVIANWWTSLWLIKAVLWQDWNKYVGNNVYTMLHNHKFKKITFLHIYTYTRRLSNKSLIVAINYEKNWCRCLWSVVASMNLVHKLFQRNQHPDLTPDRGRNPPRSRDIYKPQLRV